MTDDRADGSLWCTQPDQMLKPPGACESKMEMIKQDDSYISHEIDIKAKTAADQVIITNM